MSYQPSTIHYEQLLAAARSLIFSLDHEQHIIALSGGVQDLTGYEADDLIGKAFSTLVAPDWQDKVHKQHAEQISKAQTDLSCDYELLTANGEKRSVRHTTSLLNEGDTPTLQGIILPIEVPPMTDAKQSDDLYRLIFDSHAEAVVVFNTDNKVVQANSAFNKLYGYEDEEVLGLSPFDLAPKHAHAQVTQWIEEENIERIQTTAKRKDGSEFPAAVDIQLVRHQGELYGVISVQDITEAQAAAEERNLLRILLDNIPDHISARNLHGEYLLANQSFAEHLGFKDASELKGKSIRDIFPDDMAAIYLSEDQEMIRSGKSMLKLPDTNVTVGDTPLWYAMRKVAIKNDEEEVVGVLAIARDITERKKAEVARETVEGRNHALLEAVPDAMFVIRRDGTFMDFHHSEYVELGLQTDKIIGANIRETSLPTKLVDDTLYYMQRAFTTQEMQAYEYELNINGMTHVYDARLVALNDEEVLKIIRDISDFKRVQEELSKHIEDLTILRTIEAELVDRLKIEAVTYLGLDAAMRLSNALTGFIAYVEDGKLHPLHTIGEYPAEKLNDNLKHEKSLLARVMKYERAEMVLDVDADPNIVKLLTDTQSQIAVPLIIQEKIIGMVNLETNKPDVFNYEMYEFLQLITGRIARFTG